MKFEDLSIILEKREYKHRQGYEGNKKGSYIEKGKTKWDYSGDATPGNERIVTQIQLKSIRKFETQITRSEVKKYLKSEEARKIFKSLKKRAEKKFGDNEDDQKYRAFLYGCFVYVVARNLSSKYKDED